MRKRVKRRCLIVSALVTAAVTSAAAADFELTPHLGFRGGGEMDVVEADRTENLDPSVAFGLTLGWSFKPTTAFEFVWSRQDTEFEVRDLFGDEGDDFHISIDYFHFVGVYRPQRDGAQPFVSFGAGFTVFSPDRPGFGSEGGFSLSAAGGSTIPLGEQGRLGLRLGARVWLTFEDASFSGTCGGTACTIDVAGSGMFQIEATAGLVIALGK